MGLNVCDDVTYTGHSHDHFLDASATQLLNRHDIWEIEGFYSIAFVDSNICHTTA